MASRSTMVLRSLVLLTLLACLVQLSQANFFNLLSPRTGEKRKNYDQAERERLQQVELERIEREKERMRAEEERKRLEEKRLLEAKKAKERLFVSKEALQREEAVQQLQILEPYAWDLEVQPDFRKLLDYNKPQQIHCADGAFVRKLNRLVETSERQYPALYNYLSGAIASQLELCDGRATAAVFDFKLWSPRKWKLIVEFNQAAKNHEVLEQEVLKSRPRMNEAFYELLESKLAKGDNLGADTTRMAHRLAADLSEACATFSERTAASLKMAAHPRPRENKELVDWLRYLFVCSRAETTNFSDAITSVTSERNLDARDLHWVERFFADRSKAK